MQKGSQQSVYINSELKARAEKVCEAEDISLSKLINRAMADYVAKREAEETK